MISLSPVTSSCNGPSVGGVNAYQIGLGGYCPGIIFLSSLPAASRDFCLAVCSEPCEFGFDQDGSCYCRCPRVSLSSSQEAKAEKLIQSRRSLGKFTIGKDAKTGNWFLALTEPSNGASFKNELLRSIEE